MDPTRSYVLEIAIAHDALELHRLFFAIPPPGGRRRLLGEVRRLIDDERMWLVRERLSGHPVGVCTIDVLRSSTGEPTGVATLDGPVILPDHRRRGLGVTLASMTIAHHFWDGPTTPLTTHLEDDGGTTRTIVERLGFRRVATARVARHILGLDHPGSTHAHAFELEEEGRARAFWRTATVLDRGSTRAVDGRSTTIYAEPHPEMSPLRLRSAAASILLDGDTINAA